MKKLPEMCYGILPSSGEIIVLKNGEKGYYETGIFTNSRKEAEEIAEERNEILGVSKAEATAMQAGSMFGWNCPAADPESYDKSGKLKHR